VALLAAFRRAMAKLGVAGKLVATDVTAASPAFQKADVGELVPPVGRAQYIPALKRLVARHKAALVVPLTDLDLRLLARHREAFAAMGCTVMIGAERDVRTCRDKARTSRLFRRAGVESIRTCRLAEFRAEPFYPCFVKPIRGSAGIGAALIHSQQELRVHQAAFGDQLVCQEYVPGQEFTIDVYRDRRGSVRCVVPRQRLEVRSGEVAKGVTVKDDELIAAATCLAGHLGSIWGAFCCQCRRAAGQRPRFFEVNPRFGGGAPLSIAAGADLPLYLLQEVLGLPITARLGRFKENLLMLRYDQAVFVQVEDRTRLPGYDTPSFR
jgi:carbamoyl-phosphate synthase large subunit